MYTAQQIARALDYAVLRPTATLEDIRIACELVRANNIRTVCVAPIYAWDARRIQQTPVCAVVGFPHGISTPEIKHSEALALLEQGVEELDVVINYGRFLDGDIQLIQNELRPIIQDAHDSTWGSPKIVKAILETCFYTTQQIDYATRLCVDLGVDFVKTSTGFGLHGATVQSVKTIMQAVKGSSVQVKASGGITCYNDAAKYLDLGCTRLGASRYKELLP